MINEPRVVWGMDGFASDSGWELAHCINQATGEYLYSQDVWVSVGTSMPAGAFIDPPPQSEPGKAIVRQHGAWELVDDLRGTVAYNKQTRQSEVVNALGMLPEQLTLLVPQSQFDVWNTTVGAWVKDATAEQAWLTQQAQSQRTNLLGEASIEIAALLDALDPAIISNPDDQVQAKLMEWKTYRAELAIIDCSVHPVNWPAKPQ
ncbi:tail fiber assembly protein [Aeromonas hydrophila]|uniref:tail fiber assembly protein n=1 Tax=Aeromonas hydrophila TaxID=644 RepID=UPI0038D018E7